MRTYPISRPPTSLEKGERLEKDELRLEKDELEEDEEPDCE